MSTLERSLAAARQTPPGKDALTTGAAAFFGVPYEDVTPEQRASWKLATSAIRNSDHALPANNPISPADARSVARSFRDAWPALREFFAG